MLGRQPKKKFLRVEPVVGLVNGLGEGGVEHELFVVGAHVARGRVIVRPADTHVLRVRLVNKYGLLLAQLERPRLLLESLLEVDRRLITHASRELRGPIVAILVVVEVIQVCLLQYFDALDCLRL